MHVGGEHGHDHPALGLLEHVDEGLADLGLAHGVTLAGDIGGFAQEAHHAVVAQHGKAGQVRNLAVDGGEVHLKVAAENDRARRAGDGNGHGPCDGMVHVDKFDMEATQIQFVPGLDDVERNPGDAVLLELEIHQRQRQLGAVQGHGHLTEHVGGGADMVFMAVGQKHPADAILVLDQVGHVGNDQIHAQHIFLRENGTAVHYQHILAVFHHGDVFAEFVHAAQRNDPKLFFLLLCLLCHNGLLSCHAGVFGTAKARRASP